MSAVDVRIAYQKRGARGKSVLAIDGVNLEIHPGEFVSVVGPSGCGKTTFLKAMQGLLPVSSGSIRVNGAEVRRPGPDRAMVFQSPCILPWRTVLRNVMYGLELQRKVSKAEAVRRAEELIRLVDLDGFERAYPRELSGGMQQRVNLARALATDPEMLLLDEPFAALDAQTREFMQLELLRLWSQTKKTAVFVTHDIGEAIYLADRVVVFSARPGRVRTIVPIALERPRSLSIKRSTDFLRYEDEIWQEIEEEVKTAKSPSRARVASGSTASGSA